MRNARVRLTALPEPLRFAIVGAIGFAVDGAVLYTVLWFFPAAVLLARVPSFLVAATATWWLHRHVTFFYAPRHGRKLVQWLAFVGTNSAGNIVNLGTYMLLAGVARWYPIAALAVASIVAAVLNYVVSRVFVFRVHKRDEHTTA